MAQNNSHKHTHSLASLSEKQIQWLGILGACACASIPLYVADPVRVGFFPRCPIYALTGLYCAGCGTTRALHQLLHGNLRAAFRFNPLALVLLHVFAYSFLSLTLEAFKGKALPRLFRTRLSIRLLIGAVMAFSILRNIPRYPFTLLAPTSPRTRI